MMNKMKRTEFEFDSARYKLGETNDCSVVAVAHVTRGDYKEAHSFLKAAGRPHRKGAFTDQIMAAVRAMGYEVTPATRLFPRQPNGHAYTSKTVDKLIDRLGEGVYLVSLREHIYAHVYGSNLDSCRVGRHHIRRVYRVTVKGRNR